MEEKEPTYFEALALLEEIFQNYCLPPSVYLKRDEVSEKQKQIINSLFSKIEKMLINEKSELDKIKNSSILKPSKSGIIYRTKGSAIEGELGLFFDSNPDLFIKDIIENGLNNCKSDFQFGICTGFGKHQVSNEYAYWNYYLPEKSFSQLNIDPKYWIPESKWQEYNLS